MALQLSSRWTPFYKIALPVLCAAGFGFGAAQAWLHPDQANGPAGFPPEYKWVAVVMLGLLIGVIVWWTIGGLKAVTLDDDELIISNYRTEIRVPLRDVESISEVSMTNPRRYTITVAEPTEFGRKVTFIPTMDWTVLRWQPSEAITVLMEAWEAAKRH